MAERLGRLQSIWTDLDGLRIHARVSVDSVPPEAPTVVLIHGLVVSSRYMTPTAERLAPNFQVYAPDLPGFGLSGKPGRVLDVPELAGALVAWMDANGLDRPILLANSFGCQVITDLASRYPDRVERVVLQGPTFPPKERIWVLQFVRWVQNGLREPGSLIPIVLRDYWDCGPLRAFQTLRYAMRDRVEEKLPRVRVPTLVVRGDYDTMCPQPWAEKVIRLLPDGRLLVIPGAPHTLVYSAPLELVRVVRPFLDEARATGRRAATLGESSR